MVSRAGNDFLQTGFLKTPPKINGFSVVAGGWVAGHRWLVAGWLATKNQPPATRGSATKWLATKKNGGWWLATEKIGGWWLATGGGWWLVASLRSRCCWVGLGGLDLNSGSFCLLIREVYNGILLSSLIISN